MPEPTNTLTLRCPTCGHTWQVTLDDLQGEQYVVYRAAEGGKTPVETRHDYLVTCPNCGRRWTVTVTIKEG